MIISPPRLAQTHVPSMHGAPFLDEIDDYVDSFSTVFTPITVSEVNMLALPISSTAPLILANEQYEHL